ncbi:MAG: hypothetical protein A2096_06930 [Spirochaetes bacterium GWF1_41_5]|nr:MAG: hypothetical protein A2096_06930 [Spirochaetes bacterium GWF1_41_5]HBE04420.1 hypothetical protein [Spirochaetia bacterium]
MKISLRNRIFLFSLLPLNGLLIVYMVFLLPEQYSPRLGEIAELLRGQVLFLNAAGFSRGPQIEKLRNQLERIAEHEVFSDFFTRRRYQQIAMVLSFTIIISMLYFFILGRIISLPFERLEKRLQSVMKGEYTIAVKLPDDPETAQIHKTLNIMAEELKAREKTITEQARVKGWRDIGRVFTHEMRNLLTPVKIFIEDLYTMDAGQAEKIPGIIKTQGGAALYSISAIDEFSARLKDLTSLSPGKLEKKDTSAIIKHAVSVLEQAFPGGKVFFQHSGELFINCDENCIFHALYNIMKNSMESYDRPETAETRISASCFSGRIGIFIRDRGKGISREQLAKVFEPNFTLKKEGMGVGLFYSEKIIREHGGNIYIRSAPGQGTEVEINLPEYA